MTFLFAYIMESVYRNNCSVLLILLVLFSCSKETVNPNPIPTGLYSYDHFKGNEMMIITVSKFVDELQPFIQYKRSLGMNVEVNTSSASQGTYEVKSVLQRKYSNETLQFIILVGDIEDVPSPYFQGAPSDPTYTLLEGDDLMGDALISRISVKTPFELKNIINKLLIYEKGEFASEDWISNAIVVGTHEFDGVNHTSGITNVMKDKTSYFKNVAQILQTDQNPHADLMDAIDNQGANMIVYNSHGSENGFHSIEFSNSNIPELNTFGNSFPFIHGAACSTGTFDWVGGDCFAEAILKTGTYEKPTGAIGMLAFSRSTSASPAMMAQRIAFKELYFNNEITTIGELCYYSNLLAMKEYGVSESEQLFKHWHLFGDCSAPIWKHVP